MLKKTIFNSMLVAICINILFRHGLQNLQNLLYLRLNITFFVYLEDTINKYFR